MEQGHAAIRYVNPTTGGDVMPTLRAEFHRLRAGADTPTRHEVGSSVWQVFEGDGAVVLGGVEHPLSTGDIFAVPVLGIVVTARRRRQFDLFRFNDAPIIDRLHFTRTYIPQETA